MRKGIIFSTLLAAMAFGLPVEAETGPLIGVRVGAHDKFDRIVFDWPYTVKFQLRHENNRAYITFDSDAKIKLPLNAQLTRAQNFSLSQDEANKVTISFSVAAGTSFKTFTNATSVVVDIHGKAAPLSVNDERSKNLPNAPFSAPPADTTAQKLKSALKADKEQSKLLSQLAKDTITVDSVGDKQLASPASEPSGKEESLATTVTAAPVATPPAESKPPQRVEPPPPPPGAAPPTSMEGQAAPAHVNPDILSDTPTLVASLDPHVPIRAVIYRRAGVAYVVFDRKLSLPMSALQNGILSKVDLQPFELPKNSAYRFPITSQADLYATLDGTAWKIFISKKKSEIPVTTLLIAQPNFALGARFLLPLPDAPEPIRFVDPVVGDDLILVPLAQSEAFNVERKMAEMTILPAAQGLVIKPLIEKLIVRAVSDGIEITSETGLLLSSPVDTGATLQSAGKTKAAAAGKSIFDFTTWKGKPGETFTQTRQRLQQIIVDVTEAERNRARMELARFYFANGYGEEAVSLLKFIASQVPDLRSHADFMALLGASEILAYRSEDGIRDLSVPALTAQPEVDLWMAAGLAQTRDWQHAEEKFAVRKSILTGYPEPFYSRFFVLAIESALAAGKDREAAEWLVYVSSSDHSPLIDPALSFLRGTMEAKAGRAASAEEAWKEAQASNNRLYKVRAELALIDLGVSTGSLTPAQAADRLEALRFGWRGDDLEVDILRRLGQFYIQANNVKAGINAMSQAVMLYPSSPLVPAIRAEMAKNFHDIFLGDLGKKFSPLDALALYQQYRTLMPTGKEGDAVLANLAERLVAVDLLDQAASILDDMSKNRLQGEEKARAALRLSAIRLLDHKPDEALAALDILSNDSLSSDLQNQRILLRARSFSELNRNPEALALLKDNESQGARLLRVDIAMHDQKWSDATRNLMDLVGPPPSTGASVTPQQAEWLTSAALAYALADDQPNLDRLAIDYGAAMSQMPQKDTFFMLTKPGKTGQLRDLAAAQVQLTQADMFQNFLNTYRSTSSKDVKAKKP